MAAGGRRRAPWTVAELVDTANDSAASAVWFVDFDEFYSARAMSLLRLARLQLQDDQAAEDAVADVLSKILTKWPQVRRLDYPDAYIRRMVMNECISYKRRASNKYEYNTDPNDLPEIGLADQSETNTERASMWLFLRELSPHQRAVIVLRYYERIPDEEIAQILDIARVTVRSHALNALKKLRRLLEADGEA